MCFIRASVIYLFIFYFSYSHWCVFIDEMQNGETRARAFASVNLFLSRFSFFFVVIMPRPRRRRYYAFKDPVASGFFLSLILPARLTSNLYSSSTISRAYTILFFSLPLLPSGYSKWWNIGAAHKTRRKSLGLRSNNCFTYEKFHDRNPSTNLASANLSLSIFFYDSVTRI